LEAEETLSLIRRVKSKSKVAARLGERVDGILVPKAQSNISPELGRSPTLGDSGMSIIFRVLKAHPIDAA